VREAAGRRPRVQAVATLHVDREPLERGLQLLAGAGREASRLPHELERRGGVDQGGGLAGRPARDQDQPVAHCALRLAAGGDEAAAHELGVESPARHGSGVRPARREGLTWRASRWTAWPSTACAWTSCPARALARARAFAAHPPRRGTRPGSSSPAPY